MTSKASLNQTVVSIDLNIKTIEWAAKLGLDLSGMASRLLKLEIKKRLKEIKACQSKPEVPG